MRGQILPLCERGNKGGQRAFKFLFDQLVDLAGLRLVLGNERGDQPVFIFQNSALTEAEYQAIERKFRNSGLRSRSEFIRTMIFEGYIVNFDEEKFDKIYRLVGSIANNINQIAVRVNSTNKVYAEDIVNIKEGQDKIWQLLNSLQSKLLRLKR